MDSTSNTPEGTTTIKKQHTLANVATVTMQFVVIAMSALLIIFISYDTFQGQNFMENHLYMKYQFWMCLAFIADYFVEMAFAENKWRYAWRRLPFLLISIPYLNILPILHLQAAAEHFYLLRYIPLTRAALAISIIFGYFSKNAVTSFFMSYIVILLMVVYFGSLIFFQYENGVNKQVTDYWMALWWAAMNVTTVGCYINPMTVEGRIVAIILPITGTIIFPLFTVYLTDFVKRHSRSDIKQ
ncbi:MAG: potassium channel family protein [Muribaculum sp.]|nr:potassium channel family protein [Muribaculum sp.]